MITYPVNSQKLVFDYSPELTGLQNDMPLQQALSRHGEVELLQADLPYYWSVFNEILESLELKSPLVEGADLGCAYLGLDGLQRIYLDDKTIINAVREAVPESFSFQMGISDGKFPAYLASLRSPLDGYQILTGDIEAFLKELSCDILPISLKSRDKLHGFGIHTLGQAANLPLGPLQSQFGPEGRKIHDLARGYDDTPLYPRMMEEIIEENTALTSVTVSLEAIVATWGLLLSRVLAKISHRGLGIRSVILWTRSWNSEYWEHSLRLKEPAMEARNILPRLKHLLENYPQPGPVEQLGMRITRLGHPGGQQKSLFPEVRDRDHLIGDIRQLELRLGGPQVFKIKEVEPWSRIPERRYALTPLSQ